MIVLAVLLGATTAASRFAGFEISPASETISADQIKPLETRVDPATKLIREHDCWTLETGAPADMVGKFPTHAIVGGKYVGKRVADLAFDQEVGGHDRSLTVSAFCR